MAKRATTLEERVMVYNLAQADLSDSDIAEQLALSVPTVRKWRRRAEKGGAANLASSMGRPSAGAMGTFPPVVQKAVEATRHAHPGWGPLTLCAELASDPSLAGKRLPSRAGIARWLHQQGLSRSYRRHQELPQPALTDAHAPHEAWEMDARGYQKVPGVGVVALIDLNDRFSKVKLMSYPCLLGEQRANRHPDTRDHRTALRLTASEWGLPDRLCVDRDSVFHETRVPSPFPTLFHLWVLALGVDLELGPPHQPRRRAMTERSHQTWGHQAIEGQTYPDWQALWEFLRKRRHFLNEQLPHAALGNVPPLVACPQARTPRRLYRPEWEADLLDLSRVFAYLSRGRWFRKGSSVGTVSLGYQTYALGTAFAREEVEVTFDPGDQHLVFHSPKGPKTKRLPPQGISPTDLMGEPGPLHGLHDFQLALPFTWRDWQVIQLYETMRGTT